MRRDEYEKLNSEKLSDHRRSGNLDHYIVYGGNYANSYSTDSIGCNGDFDKALKEFERFTALYDWVRLTVVTRIGTSADLKTKGLRFDDEASN